MSVTRDTCVTNACVMRGSQHQRRGEERRGRSSKYAEEELSLSVGTQ